MQACLEGDVPFIQRYLAEMDRPERDFPNPVTVTSASGYTSMRTPLAAACSGGHTHLAELLLAAGAEPDYCYGEDMLTALQVACQEGRNSAVQLLLRHKASVSRQNRQGVSPLHCTTLQGDVTLAKTKAGWSEAEQLIESSHSDVVRP